MKETAAQNAGGKLPERLAKLEYPEMPPPLDEAEIADVTIDLTQAAIDAAVDQDLDESGIERIPTADPGLDVSRFLFDATIVL